VKIVLVNSRITGAYAMAWRNWREKRVENTYIEKKRATMAQEGKKERKMQEN